MLRSEYTAKLCPEVYYHVYNRTNHRESLFKSDGERYLFLEKYKTYMAAYIDTFAWCLMENHFHFCVRVKTQMQIIQEINSVPEVMRTATQRNFLETPSDEKDFHTLIEKQFARLFTSYAMTFNRTHQRRGNLFHRPFKRIEITHENHLVWLVYYIHSNIAKHGITANFFGYKWSSYQTYLNRKSTMVCRNEVIDWFGGEAHFQEFHGHGYRELPDNYLYFELE